MSSSHPSAFETHLTDIRNMLDSDKPFDLEQNIFKASFPVIRVTPYHEANLTKRILSDFLGSVDNGCIGVAPAYGSNCKLTLIALSTISEVMLIRLSPNEPSKKKRGDSSSGRKLMQSKVFCNSKVVKCAFKMDKLATALFMDVQSRITRGADLLSLLTSGRHETKAVLDVLGGEMILKKGNVIKLFFSRGESAKTPRESIALQAWAAYQAGTVAALHSKRHKQSMVNTKILSTEHLAVLAKVVRDANRLEALKPTRVANEINANFSHSSGKLSVHSKRYKTRIRSSKASNQKLEISITADGQKHTIAGRAVEVKGPAATIQLGDTFHESDPELSIWTLGKQKLTNAELKREIIVLGVLQGSNMLLSHSFVRLIWLPSEEPSFLSAPRQSRVPLPVTPQTQGLNFSQRIAVEAIVSDDEADRLVPVQGPPGTGKTSVIACATQCLIATPPCNRTVWLIAQSNVAVKNIAERLAKDGFHDFKLLVSKEFHAGWHEHLYETIERNVIRSDKFETASAELLLVGSRVILCTLSMLSNNLVVEFTQAAPVEIVIVDEASQIEIGGYIPMLDLCQRTLRKLVFVGDDKQLAPYGQDELGDLSSIFEVSHLRNRALFLNIQYRMPVPLGSFISFRVYCGQLLSRHSINSLECVRFIDCVKGQEEKSGFSYKNIPEIRVVIALARKYSLQKLSFRIITPYDAQRSAIEEAMKQENLPWEDKCFNVDAFQGNEDDHIIISLTRSEKIGFLKEARRTNVMLTRCKKSMVICTSRAFLNGVASLSLVSALAEWIGTQAWVDSREVQFAKL